jgi:hypothetical protein
VERDAAAGEDAAVIDDILCEAYWEIVWYLARYPQRYAAVEGELAHLLAHMQQMQRRLEKNPFFLLDDEPHGPALDEDLP